MSDDEIDRMWIESLRRLIERLKTEQIIAQSQLKQPALMINERMMTNDRGRTK